MSISVPELQAQDDAYIQQAKENQPEQPKKKPDPSSIFTAELGSGSVSPETFHQALAYADNMARRQGSLYSYVRTAAVTFFSGYKEGNALEDACARLCIPLLGLGRSLDHVGVAATSAQHRADNGGKKMSTVRFADVQGVLQTAERELLEALKLANHELVHVFVNFVSGSISEHDRAREFSKDIHNKDAASLLGAAADVIKDGGHSMHAAASAGATTTDDFETSSTLEKHGAAEHGVHLREKAGGGYEVVNAAPGAFGSPEQTEGGDDSP